MGMTTQIADAYLLEFTTLNRVQNGPVTCPLSIGIFSPLVDQQIRGKLSINGMTLFTYENPFSGNN